MKGEREMRKEKGYLVILSIDKNTLDLSLWSFQMRDLRFGSKTRRDE
jgi:hypothetical protein